MNERSTGKTVHTSLDLNNPCPLSLEQKAEIELLRSKSDDEMDFTDIPKLGEKRWQRVAGSGSPLDLLLQKELQQREPMSAETVSIAADVIQFFRAQGDASPGRINEALRDYITNQQKVA